MANKTVLPKLLAAQWQNTLQYPGMLAIWMLDTFFVPLVLLMVWKPILSGTPQESSATIYYTLLPLSTMMTAAWHGVFFAQKIRTGELNAYLLKPLHHIWYDITNNISEKAFKLIILLPAVVITMSFFNVHLPTNPAPWVIFGCLLLLCATLNFIVELVIGFLAFWLEDISSLINFIDISVFTLGGRLIPVFLFPASIYSYAKFLPFRYLFAFPVEYISGQITYSELSQSLWIMLFWFGLFSAIAYVLWQKGVKNYSANGG